MRICDNQYNLQFQRWVRVEDWELMKAIAWVESNYVAHAVSRVGAVGIMQLMPTTASLYGVSSEAELYDPEINIRIGCAHFEAMYWLFDGNKEKAIASYNCGGGRLRNIIDQYGSRWKHHLPSETKAYLPKVLNAYRQIKKCPT